MVSKGHALSRDELIRVLTVYQGTTTAIGAGDGSTLIDSGLMLVNDYVTSKTILIMSGAAINETSMATVFNPATGHITVDPAFNAQIVTGTLFRILNLPAGSSLVDILARIGTPTDAGDAATLFGRNRREVLAVHAHILLVVHNASALDADLDTALKDWMEELGYGVTVADPADVAANLDVDAFDFIVVSGSCVVGDVANLANLRTAELPILCHSAAIAVSTVFNLGATAGSEAAQTQIEIKDNSPAWLIEQAIDTDLTVTASAAIQTMGTKTANAITIAEEATVTGNDLTIVKLPQGEEDGGVPTYAPFYDRYFNGVADYTNANAAWKTLMASFLCHMLHERRYEIGVVQVKRAYQEQIPDIDFSLAAIDNALTNPPPTADAENSIVDIDQKHNRTFVLRSLWVDVTSFGTAGTKLTFQLWVLINGTVTSVDSVDVAALGIQNLMDLFALPEVHADGIWITVITDSASADAACEGTFRYAEAKK